MCAPLDILHAEDVTEKHVPEALILAFLASPLKSPVFDELLCGLLLNVYWHTISNL